ncbi:MAG: EamA family transporter [Paludibacteraceae bacterium]|nr:EamA family transporter [Paludibacteraceae bacterium]
MSLFSKSASLCPFLSWQYILWLVGAVGIMGIYAICWQQILKHIKLSTAFMFKGTSLIFIMLIAWMVFGEQITLNNIIGACVIITGIALYAKE